MAKQPSQTKVKKKEKKNISNAIAHVNSSFNNTLVTITDHQGNTIAWSSSGSMGFKGSRKSTPFAGQSAGERLASRAVEDFGMENVKVFVNGPGPGREAYRAFGHRLKILVIADITGVPHNGCRARKEKRN